MGLPEEVRALVERLERITGPLTPLEPFRSPYTWHLEGRYRGHALLVGVFTDHGQLYGVEHGVSLAGRRMDLQVDFRLGSGRGLPRVITGDVAFDEAYLAEGWPPSVLRGFLDAETRHLFLSRWPPPRGLDRAKASLGLRTDRDHVRCYLGCHRVKQLGQLTTVEVPTEAALRESLDRNVAIAERLFGLYDADQAQRLAAGGPPAVEAWLREGGDVVAAAQRTSQGKGRAILALVLAVVLLGALALGGCIVVGVLLASR